MDWHVQTPLGVGYMQTLPRQARRVPYPPAESRCITISNDRGHGVWSWEARCVWIDLGPLVTSRRAYARSRISRGLRRRRETKAESRAKALQQHSTTNTRLDAAYAPPGDGEIGNAPAMASPPWTITSVATKSRTGLRDSLSSSTDALSTFSLGVLLSSCVSPVADILEMCW